MPYRLLVLGVAIFLHATLSQLMYARLYVQVSVPPAELRGGAELMYYGGDIAETAARVRDGQHLAARNRPAHGTP